MDAPNFNFCSKLHFCIFLLFAPPTLWFHHLGSGTAWVLELSFDRLRIYIKEISFFFSLISAGVSGGERRDRERTEQRWNLLLGKKWNNQFVSVSYLQITFFPWTKMGIGLCVLEGEFWVFFISLLPLMTSQNIQQQQQDRAGPKKL